MTMDVSWLDVCKLDFHVGYMLVMDAIWQMMVGSLLISFLIGLRSGAPARAMESKQAAGREEAA